jgi:hypothetical protein
MDREVRGRERSLSLLLVLAACVLAAPTAPASAQTAPQYSIAELSGVPARLNDNGQIAGWIYVGPNAHAAIYRGGAWVDLGVPPGDQLSALFGINNLGAVAGYSFLSTPLTSYPYTDNRWQAIWAPANATAVQALSVVAPDSFAYAINDAGSIAGCLNRYDDEYPDPHRAYLYAGGTLIDLHALLTPPSSQTAYDFTCALDINTGGDVVGEVALYSSDKRGFLYRSGSVRRLVDGASYLLSGRAINDSGKIVGEGRLSGFTADHALVYDAATSRISSLGVETTGAASSRPNDVNRTGDVVGTMYSPVYGDHAFLTSGGRAYDLNDLIPAGSGWVLQEALSINARGQIVGRGILSASPDVTRYFLLDASAPGPAIDGLIAKVRALQASGFLSKGTATALIADLQIAAKFLKHGCTRGSVQLLEVFVHQVDTLIRTRRLSPTKGQPLIDEANRIIASLTRR